MQIKPGTFVFTEARMRKNRGNMGFIGRFIFRKPRVAVDTIGRDLRGCDHFWSKLLKFPSQSVNEVRHRLFDMLFVNTFVFLKPFPIIIALQSTEEVKTFLRES